MSLSAFKQDFPNIIKLMLQAAAADRLAHGYMFIGDDNTYLETIALEWAKVCVCLNRTPEGDACDSCRHCKLVETENYPDLYSVRPKSKSRRILVDDMRNLLHQLGLTSTSGGEKIGMIIEADRMQEQAQNAFLKTLEEPAVGTRLILLTTHPEELLPTIRSRCQLISLRRNTSTYKTALKTGLFDLLTKLQPGSGAATALAVSEQLQRIFSSLRKLVQERMEDEDDNSNWRELAQDDPKLRKQLEESKKVQLEAEYIRMRHEILDAIQTFYMQQYLISSGTPHELLPNQEMLPKEHSLNTPPEAIEAILKESDDLLKFISGNVNERLAIDAFCLAASKRR